MTATAHAIIGTIIAAKIGNPYLAIPIAIASHFAADAVPHWDTALNRKTKGKTRVLIDSIADIVIGFAVSYLILVILFPKTDLFYAIFMILVSQLPDWLMGLYYFLGIKQFRWAYTLGKATNRDLDKPWGIISQAAVVILIIILAKLI